MNTPINRGAILIDSSMPKEFLSYEVSPLLQQGVLKGATNSHLSPLQRASPDERLFTVFFEKPCTYTF